MGRDQAGVNLERFTWFRQNFVGLSRTKLNSARAQSSLRCDSNRHCSECCGWPAYTVLPKSIRSGEKINHARHTNKHEPKDTKVSGS